MFNRAFRAALAAAAALGAIASAAAYEFTPIVAVFAPSGPGATQTFTVRNTQVETVALQIEVVRRTQTADGGETHEPELDDFIVTPPQLVVAPGASQTVRAQWIGDPAPGRELNYRFIVTQLPIRYERERSGDRSAAIMLGYKYEAAVYVTPPGAEPAARLVGAEPREDAQGQTQLAVTIASEGNTRAILEQPSLRLTGSNGQSVTLEGERAEEIANRNILSGATVTYLMDWPAELPVGPVTGELSTGYFVAG